MEKTDAYAKSKRRYLGNIRSVSEKFTYPLFVCVNMHMCTICMSGFDFHGCPCVFSSLGQRTYGITVCPLLTHISQKLFGIYLLFCIDMY